MPDVLISVSSQVLWSKVYLFMLKKFLKIFVFNILSFGFKGLTYQINDKFFTRTFSAYQITLKLFIMFTLEIKHN